MDTDTERSDEACSWMKEVMPFVAMFMVACLDMSVLTIVKAAMNDGMSSIVYIVYHDALGIFILLPFFIIGFFRNANRPPLSFRILFRFFILGLLGICLFQVLSYQGIYYSSPTMASAISNLSPGNTFLFAVAFRMEKIDIRSSSSLAKLLGTTIAISGAMLFTVYKGLEIFHMGRFPDSSNQLHLSRPSDWIFGGLILVIGGIFGAIWNVVQSATAREYPDQHTFVFFYCLFGTIQCIALSPFLEPNIDAWVLLSKTGMIAVVFGGVFSVVFRSTAITWCLEKKGPVFVAMFSPLSIVIAVIMGVTFLGDSLHLGSAIGATIVAAGFYTVMWGQAKEKNKLPIATRADLDVSDEPGSSDQTAPLLSSRIESNC
ncbi:putative EamA domain-containing protein [Helianthus annuus]|nr:putative EamA domain-containing protein [Helianthus annuus]